MKLNHRNEPTRSPRASDVKNCRIVVRHKEKADYLFYFSSKDEAAEGDAYVVLDGYLICPLEMFSKRQINMATEKYARITDEQKDK